MPPVGANTPFCSGGCPPFKKCILFQKDLNGNGNAEWYCKCVNFIPPLDDVLHPAKNRYLSFRSGAAPGEMEAVHYKVLSLNGLPPGVPYEGWFGPPGVYQENPTPLPTFIGTKTQCDPHFADWAALGLAHGTGPDVIPNSVYELRTVSMECDDLTEPECYSDPLMVITQKWGDTVDPFATNGAPLQPNFLDISSLVDKFRALPGAIIKAQAQLQPHVPNPASNNNFLDISAGVDAFRGRPFPYSGPCTCPAATICPMLDACGRCRP
jgi:hypothetical protein